MSRSLPKPRRSLRSELAMLVPILALPVAVALAFPYRAVAFREVRVRQASEPSCAFVALDDGVEAKAMDVVRAAFSVKPGQFRDLRADLSLASLPEEPPTSIVSFRERRAPAPSAPVPYDVSPFPPSEAAPDPVALAEPSAERAPVFSREELLHID